MKYSYIFSGITEVFFVELRIYLFLTDEFILIASTQSDGHKKSQTQKKAKELEKFFYLQEKIYSFIQMFFGAL